MKIIFTYVDLFSADDFEYNNDAGGGGGGGPWENGGWDQHQSWDRWGHHPSFMPNPFYYDPFYPSG